MHVCQVGVLEEAPEGLLLLLYRQIEEKEGRRLGLDLPSFVINGPCIETKVPQAACHPAAASKQLNAERTTGSAELKSLPIEFPRAAGASRWR